MEQTHDLFPITSYLAQNQSCIKLKWGSKIHLGENMVKGTRVVKVKVLFQGLYMTRVIFALVYNLVFWIPNLTLHVRYKYVLNTI
jgi:hypothetical protein